MKDERPGDHGKIWGRFSAKPATNHGLKQDQLNYRSSWAVLEILSFYQRLWV